jgi:hypothetical protein
VTFLVKTDAHGGKKNGKHLARRVSKMHTTHGIIGSDAHQNPKKKSGHLSKATDRNNPEYAIDLEGAMQSFISNNYKYNGHSEALSLRACVTSI